MKFNKGDRVRMTKQALVRFPTCVNRLGTVACQPRQDTFIMIQWDGRKTVASYAANFFELAGKAKAWEGQL
jgi:hypothetical protein